jgi:ParB/RepB/Spo0J family partition protein
MAKASTATKKKPTAAAETPSPKAAAGDVKLLPHVKVSPQSPKIVAGVVKDALAAANATKTTIQVVPIDAIQIIPGFNARKTDTREHAEKIDGLIQSMKKDGYDPAHPLTGFVGKDEDDQDAIFVTDGHGRLEAARRANDEGADIKAVPMVLRPASTTMKQHNVNLIRENSGKELTLAEKAIVVKRLLKLGVDEAELAEELNITQRYVDQIIMLINAPQMVRSMVNQGRITGTEAIRLLTKHRKNPAKAEEAVMKMVANAEAAGETRATRKHSEEGTKLGRRAVANEEGGTSGRKLTPKTETLRTTFGPWSEGDEFPLADIRQIRGILPDSDWFTTMSDREGYAVATEDFKVEVLITRPKKVEPKVTDGEAAPPKKRARRLKDDVTSEADEADERDEDEADKTEDAETDDLVTADADDL